MPLLDLHLVSLKPDTSAAAFLTILKQHSITPLVQSRVLRWMILPTSKSTAPLLSLNTHWDLLLLLPHSSTTSTTSPPLPAAAHTLLAASWTATIGVPTPIVTAYPSLTHALLHPSSPPAPPALPLATAPTGQKLQLSAELAAYVAALPATLRARPVSMLNLLAFAPGQYAQYARYGAEFGRVGGRYGGRVKLVGKVTGGDAGAEGWDEVALVQYPTLGHFAAMAGGGDYQEVNERYRLGALADTFILCVLEGDEEGGRGGDGGSRL